MKKPEIPKINVNFNSLDSLLSVDEDSILKRKFGLIVNNPELTEEKRIELQKEYDTIYMDFKSRWELEGKNFKPSLKDITNYMTNNIIGERSNILTIFLLMTGGISVNIEGPAGSGKTQLQKAFSKVIYPGKIYYLEGASDTALVYDCDRINECDYVIIGELNKLDNKSMIIEILKNFGENKNYSRTVPETGTKRPRTYVIQPKTFISGIADESKEQFGMGTELSSRVLNVRTTTDRAHTEDILDFQASAYDGRGQNVVSDRVEECMYQHFVGTLPTIGLRTGSEIDSYQYDIFIPGASYISKLLPSHFHTVTRDNPKFLKGITGITKFHHYDRMIYVNKRGFETYIATPQDVFLGYLLFGKMIVDSAKKISVEEEIALNYIKYGNMVTLPQIRAFLRKFGYSMTERNLSRILDNLIGNGYVDDTKVGNVKKYSITELYEKMYNEPVNFKKCVDIMKQDVLEQAPELYDEYCQRYCSDNALRVKDPINGGQVLDIQTYDFGLLSQTLRTNKILKEEFPDIEFEELNINRPAEDFVEKRIELSEKKREERKTVNGISSFDNYM